MPGMVEVTYKQCSECGHMFEIVTTEPELLADGFAPVDVDEDGQGYIFKQMHGNDCEAELIVYRDDLFED